MKWVVVLLACMLSTAFLAPASTGGERLTGTDSNSSRGTIRWHDCSAANRAAGVILTDFECGTLTVPLDWDNPDNPTNAHIKMAIHRTDPEERIGALTFNPGGPGVSGLMAAGWQPGVLPSRVTTSFDYVAWDPRGVGLSQPQLTNCPNIVQTYPVPTGPVDWHEYVSDRYRIVGTATSECLANNVDVAPYLGTYYVIRDLEALRLALGFRAWNFIGQSYGSRVGYWYARQFPERIRTLVLDASYSPTQTVTSDMTQQASSYLTTQTVFSSLFGNRMGYRLQRIFDAINDREVVIGSVTFNRWELLDSLFSEVAYQFNYPTLLDQINSTYRALFTGPKSKNDSRLSTFQTRSSAKQVVPQDQGLLNPVVNCRDLSDYPSIEETTIAAQAAARTSMYSALETVISGANCAGFPSDYFHGFLPATAALNLATGPVVISSLGDHILNYNGARTMANYLSDSALITYNGTQHVTYSMVPSQCVNDPVTRYLISAQTPKSRFCKYVKYQ